MTYKISRKTNTKMFVLTEDIKLIKSIIKEETKNGNEVIIKELHDTRWYNITPETITSK